MKATLVSVISSLLFAGAAPGADWPQFRGPDRNGTAPMDKVSIVEVFGDEGPRVAWKADVGSGFAGPVVADGKALVFHRKGNEAVLQAFDAKSGKPIWKSAYATSYRDGFGFDNGPKSCPTIDRGQVFTYGVEGVIRCVDLKNGDEIWTVDAAKDFQSPTGFFGRACAPLLAGDVVIINVGGKYRNKPAGVVALDRKTGSVVWQADDHEASYSSPVLTTFQKQPCVVLFTREGLLGLDPSTGKVYFSEHYRPKMHASVNASSPVILGNNRFLLTTCYGVGAKVWEVTPGMKTKEVWAREGSLDGHYATPVCIGDYLFGFHGRQEMGEELRCIEAKTGKLQWTSGPMAPGSVISAGGKLLIVTEKGELIIAPADPKAFKVLARGQILSATGRPIPAYADGFLYAKDAKRIVCVDLRKKP